MSVSHAALKLADATSDCKNCTMRTTEQLLFPNRTKISSDLLEEENDRQKKRKIEKDREKERSDELKEFDYQGRMGQRESVSDVQRLFWHSFSHCEC